MMNYKNIESLRGPKRYLQDTILHFEEVKLMAELGPVDRQVQEFSCIALEGLEQILDCIGK
jgi:hypothetical protein